MRSLGEGRTSGVAKTKGGASSAPFLFCVTSPSDTEFCTQLRCNWRPKAAPANIAPDAPSQAQQKDQHQSREGIRRDSNYRPTSTRRTGNHHRYERIGKSLCP